MESLDARELRDRYAPEMLTMLKELTGKNPGILAAQVSTIDGFEVVAIHRNEESRRRLAAMASSMHALGSALVQEVDVGSCENLVLEGSRGKVLMMSVPGCDGTLLLTAIASEDALLGHFHYACKTCCGALGRQLASSPVA